MRAKYIKSYIKTILFFILLIISINIIVYLHAYNFTNFDNQSLNRTSSPSEIGFYEKVKVILSGVKNPKPQITSTPSQKHKTIHLKNDKTISIWSIPTKDSKGTIILFHGFSSSKSSLIPYSNLFISLGYSTVLVDFRGCGDSEGYNTTIGYDESKDVALVYNYVKSLGEKNIILFGSSMGAVAILKSVSDYKLTPNELILQCPFESLNLAIKNRFDLMNIPSFLFSDLLLFWGGYINNFDAETHNCINYAKNIKTQTLLMYGDKDDRVRKPEVINIFNNLQTNFKSLKIFDKVGHNNFIDNQNKEEWIIEVKKFIKKNHP